MSAETPALAGVIGWPVGHSRSPLIHNAWLRRHGIAGSYVPLAVAPDRIEAALRGLPALGFRGANVTVPHKRAALDLCDAPDAVARRIGAVNTLICRSDGSVAGTNTDAPGFIASLGEGAPRWHAAVGPAVLLGAGGAARAIAVGLLDAGVPALRVVNRNPDRLADFLAELADPRLEAIAWSEREQALTGAGLLVNATSLGMTGQPPLELSISALPEHAAVCDIVYAPLETPLLAAARARGLVAVDGLGMLLHQAALAFTAWFGVTPTVDAPLRRLVLDDLAR